MSKITFRADDNLIDELETFDASKSEVMRDALRTYLEDERSGSSPTVDSSGSDGAHEEESIDDMLRDRIDSLVTERLTTQNRPAPRTEAPQDVNVTIDLEGVGHQCKTASTHETDAGVIQNRSDEQRSAPDRSENTSDRSEPPEPSGTAETSACSQCGESVSSEHVYCPNCGEKTSRRLFCECGDELRSDWSFCPGCGRRTAAADVLDANGPRTRNS